jgi:hypothetical protein
MYSKQTGLATDFSRLARLGDEEIENRAEANI